MFEPAWLLGLCQSKRAKHRGSVNFHSKQSEWMGTQKERARFRIRVYKCTENKIQIKDFINFPLRIHQIISKVLSRPSYQLTWGAAKLPHRRRDTRYVVIFILKFISPFCSDLRDHQGGGLHRFIRCRVELICMDSLWNDPNMSQTIEYQSVLVCSSRQSKSAPHTAPAPSFRPPNWRAKSCLLLRGLGYREWVKNVISGVLHKLPEKLSFRNLKQTGPRFRLWFPKYRIFLVTKCKLPEFRYFTSPTDIPSAWKGLLRTDVTR